jgi:tetratricopeptide (TPR) repeat protein
MTPAFDSAPLLRQLRDDLGFRRIRSGIAVLERMRGEIDSLSPTRAHAGSLLGLLAQWIDAGFDSPRLLVEALDRFPAEVRTNLPLVDYLHIRMAEGMVEMSNENFRRAIQHFSFVQQFDGEINDRELLAIASYWTGRCLRRLGQYDEALACIARAEEHALVCGYLPMAAIMQITQSWLAFQKGRFDDATAMLRRADEALGNTDDFLNRGNIQSAHGRIARRQGRYDAAGECFECALRHYRSAGGGQLQMARTLQNLAFVKRLRTVQVQKELDYLAASRRSGRSSSSATAALRTSVERSRTEAVALVEESLCIYDRAENHRGIAGGRIIRGFLRLDAGDLESAMVEAVEAFRHGEKKQDYFVMARARLLQCGIEYVALEDQVGDPARHLASATDFAREAVAFASQTQNRRLLARAYVWQGLIFAAGSDPDHESARRCCEQATALLQPEAAQQQYVWEELEALKSTILRAAPIEPRLRAWSAGILPDVSFQQLTDEFARVVIPKVWERENRKISRVAEKLSISPKKVRRILQTVGALK